MVKVSFDGLTRSLNGSPGRSTTRRGLTRLMAGLAMGTPLALFGLSQIEAKHKKRCGPCKRRKKGKCKPKPAGTACPGGTCQGGACLPPAPSAPAVLTPISCPGPREGTASMGARRLAQTFTANGNGTIGTAEVEFFQVNAGTDLLFEIRPVDVAGVPTATVLGNVERNDLPASASSTRITARFIPPVPVTANTTYALVLTNVSASGFDVNTRNSGCAGNFFADLQANGNFVSVDGLDLVFTVAP